MFLPIAFAAVALTASSQGSSVIPPIQSNVGSATIAQAEVGFTGFAQWVPSSLAAPSAVLAVFGPALLRRGRSSATEAKRLSVRPLPQNYMYFPAAR